MLVQIEGHGGKNHRRLDGLLLHLRPDTLSRRSFYSFHQCLDFWFNSKNRANTSIDGMYQINLDVEIFDFASV